MKKTNTPVLVPVTVPDVVDEFSLAHAKGRPAMVLTCVVAALLAVSVLAVLWQTLH